MHQADEQTVPQFREWRARLDRLEGAYSDATIRAYRCDFLKFEAWCLDKGRSPLPAEAETVAGFIAAISAGVSPATLRRHMAGIAKVHRILKLADPVNDEEVSIALRRAFRTKPRRQKQARGLTKGLRDQLIAVCPETLQGLRNRAIIAVGYDTLCRRSELTSLRVEDLSPLDGGAMSILVRRAKNDPFGDGRYGYLTPPTVNLLCAWLSSAQISDGWIFRATFGRKVGEAPLHPIGVNRILKMSAEAAGCNPEIIRTLSGHSMRVGAAQDLMANGAGLLPIMKAGGWKSMNIVGRYVEHAEITVLGHLQR